MHSICVLGISISRFDMARPRANAGSMKVVPFAFVIVCVVRHSQSPGRMPTNAINEHYCTMHAHCLVRPPFTIPNVVAAAAAGDTVVFGLCSAPVYLTNSN